MKSTQEKILSSIQENKSKKELLSVQKVELGLMDDIKKQAKKLETTMNKIGSDKNMQIFKDLSKKVKDLANNTRDEINDNYLKMGKEINLLEPLMDKFIVASKELGIEGQKQPVFKNANDLIEKASDELTISGKLTKTIRKDYL